MPADIPSTTIAALPARAAVALLTMQLRAATQEAIEAEALVASDELDPARAQLRDRLAELTAERRRSLDEALRTVRSEADAAVAAAHRTAQAMLTGPPVASPATSNESPLVEPEPAVMEPAPPNVPSVSEPRLDLPSQAPVTLPAMERIAPLRDLAMEPSPSANVTIDAEAFARVFATVLGGLLDDRLGTRDSNRPIMIAAPVPPPAPVQQSFWTHARHPDVLLMGLTMVIVLVVLAAWLA